MKLLDLTQDFRGLAGDLLPDNVRFAKVLGKPSVGQAPNRDINHVPPIPELKPTTTSTPARAR